MKQTVKLDWFSVQQDVLKQKIKQVKTKCVSSQMFQFVFTELITPNKSMQTISSDTKHKWAETVMKLKDGKINDFKLYREFNKLRNSN